MYTIMSQNGEDDVCWVEIWERIAVAIQNGFVRVNFRDNENEMNF